MENNNQIALLRRIYNSETVFNPIDHSESELSKFKPLASALAELEERGLITMGNPVVENLTGYNFVSCIFDCRLTDLGRAKLAAGV